MNSNRKKILFISGRFPYPLHKGDQLVLFNNIKLTSQKYSVILITMYDNQSELDNLHIVENYCEDIVLVKRNKILSYLIILFSLLRLEPMQVSFYRSRLFKKELNILLDSNEFELIHVYMLRMAHYVRNVIGYKVISLIDSMHLNMSRRASNETGFKKVVFKYETWLLKDYEKNCIEWFDKAIVVSKIDKNHINNVNVNVIPVGVDIHKKKNCNKHGCTIIFTGNMGYFPNQDAVSWFVKKCLSLIKKDIPEVRFVVAGKNPPEFLKKMNDNKYIFIKGFVKSLSSEMCNADIAIAPMQSGSGMQIKIIEAMATGLPLVATTLGLGDIGAKNGDSIIIANTAEEFAFRCISLLKNTSQRDKISNSALDYVEKKHSWRSIQIQYINLYEDLLLLTRK